MAIGVMRFKPLSMAQASPGYFGLQNLQQGLMQGLKMQQMAEQQKLAEQKAAQEAQLMPLQQQLLEAKAQQALSGYAPAHPTALMQNLQAAGFDPRTGEYKKAARSYLERGMIPTSIKQARYAAPLAQNIIDHAEDQGFIESAKKYSTAQGRGLEAWSGISGALGLGPTDPDYVKYQTFVNTTIPQLVAETRKLLGENASVRQTELLEQAVNPASWRAGPELVQSRWDELKTLHDFAQKQAMQSPLGTLAQETDVPRGAESAQKQQYTPEQRRQAAAILQRRRAGR
jgi:hypothetical protein